MAQTLIAQVHRLAIAWEFDVVADAWPPLPASGSSRYAPNTESTSSGDGSALGHDASLGAPSGPVAESVAGLFVFCRLPTPWHLALGFVAISIFAALHLHLHLRSKISMRLCAVASFMDERFHLTMAGGEGELLNKFVSCSGRNGRPKPDASSVEVRAL